MSKDFNLNLFTAQIDQGIFNEPLRAKGKDLSKFKQSCEFNQVEKIIEKFNVSDENFQLFFDIEFVNDNFKDFLKEYPDDVEKEFVEIFITYTTILLMCENEEFA